MYFCVPKAKKRMRILFTFLALSLGLSLAAQDFTGQWKGSFNARGENGQVEYVLEINVEGNDVTGYSYTYPIFGGKKYYDICEIKGSINKEKKYIEISEVGKIKSNVPPPYRFDCFQTHKLTYTKSDELEKLSGSWEPAKLSISVCGYGSTTLERRKLKDIVSTLKADPPPPVVKKEVPKKTTTLPVAKANAKPKTNNTAKPKSSNPTAALKPKTNSKTVKKETKKTIELTKDTTSVVKRSTTPVFDKVKAKPLPRFEARVNKVLKTIEVNQDEVTVQLYDNGEIDGDTVTVTFNGDVVAFKKGLSEKPIVLKLKVRENTDNELVMYAENLGAIPPNTALMVVTVDDKRYQVTISSDEKRNGSIIFRRGD
jgi:archaellum component FlaF (FlaF/FlaG flagellin family)